MNVIIDAGDFSVDENLIISAITKTLELEEIYDDEIEVSVVLTDNDEIRSHNKHFRGIDKATDVLSFPQYRTNSDLRMAISNAEIIVLGDIIISIEKAIEQSKEFGHSFERELAFLVVHSVLHCLGYDHMDEPSEKEMFGKQEAVLNMLNMPRSK